MDECSVNIGTRSQHEIALSS